jgi:hypothetical protein
MAPFALMSPIVAGTASALGLAVSRSAMHGDSAPAGRARKALTCRTVPFRAPRLRGH